MENKLKARFFCKKNTARPVYSVTTSFLQKTFLIITLFFAAEIFCSCKPEVYEVLLDEKIFNLAEKNNFFKTENISPFYKENISWEFYSDKKISICAVKENSIPVRGIKPIRIAAFTTEKKLSWEEFNNSILQRNAALNKENSYTTEEILRSEYNRTYFFPCIQFAEDIEQKAFVFNKEELTPDSSITDKADFLTTKNIFLPDYIHPDCIALPVEKDGQNFYADQEEYPLYLQHYAECMLFSPSEKISKNKKKYEQYNFALYTVKTAFANSLFCSLKQNTNPPEVTTIAAVGDIMLARGVENLLMATENAESVFTDTTSILKNNDFTIGNLEGVVTNLSLKTPKTYNFKFNKKALPYLKQVGFDYFMLTNNHSYDYGEQGFKDTLKAVKEAGFATSGAGYNREEAEQFYRINIKGTDYSILSVGAYPVERSGFNGEKQASATETRAGILWRSEKVLQMVREEKAKGAVVIVNVHAGSEYVKKPNEVQQTFYKDLCNNGADIVFGSHPHILQPVEMYNGSLIVWSLGNYVFPGMDEMPGATDTMIIRTGFCGKKLIYYEKYPATIKDRTVNLK